MGVVDLAVAADFMAGEDLAAGFTAGAGAGSMVEAEVVVFVAAEGASVGDTGRPRLVMGPLVVGHRPRRVRGADMQPGQVMAIQVTHAPAAASPVETSDTGVLPLLRRLPPMAGGIRFPVKVGIAAHWARNRKGGRLQGQADYISIAAAAEPGLPGRLGAFRATATEFGKTRPALIT